MRKPLFLGVLSISLLSILSPAQEQRRTPQPSPEVKKLEFFVGDSTSEGTMSVGQINGKFSANDHAEWMKGGFFVENRSNYTTPFGPGFLLEIMGYDPIRHVYTHDSYTSSGMHFASTGTLDGDTWTWTSTDGRSRHIIKMLSLTSFSFKTELSADGKSWTTMVEGTSTKKN